MIAVVLAAAIATAQQSWWENTSNRLRGVAATYAKWGIKFRVESSKEFVARNTPGPARLEIVAGFEGPDKLKIGMSTMVGLRQAAAVNFGGTFTFTPEGTAKEASGGLFVEGVGVAGKLKKEVGQALGIDGAVENLLGKVSIKSGEAGESPVAFAVKLGPLTVDIDPVKYANRLREMGPEMVAKATDKLIGGVRLAVDADAMVAALANAPEPPPGYFENRQAISLKKLIADKSPTIGDFTTLEGLIFDDQQQDIFLVGRHQSSSPAIPLERLAAVARSVFIQRSQPFISLDPQGGDMTRPVRSRIGGVPEELRDPPSFKRC